MLQKQGHPGRKVSVWAPIEIRLSAHDNNSGIVPTCLSQVSRARQHVVLTADSP